MCAAGDSATSRPDLFSGFAYHEYYCYQTNIAAAIDYVRTQATLSRSRNHVKVAIGLCGVADRVKDNLQLRALFAKCLIEQDQGIADQVMLASACT